MVGGSLRPRGTAAVTGAIALCLWACGEGPCVGDEHDECPDGYSCNYLSGSACFRDHSFLAAETCSTHVNCAEGLSCFEHRCRALGGAGEACAWNEHCRGGLVCFQCACRDAGTTGASCSRGDQCVDGLACNEGYLYARSEPFGRCEPLHSGAEGHPCGGDVPPAMEGPFCLPELACNTGSHTCQPTGAAGHGAPCQDTMDGPEFCAAGLRCDTNYTPPLCLTADEAEPWVLSEDACWNFLGFPPCGYAERSLGMGLACTADAECSEGLVCRAAPQQRPTCRPLGQAGDWCCGFDCRPGLACDRLEFRCAPVPGTADGGGGR